MEHNQQPETFEQINVVTPPPKRDYFLPVSIMVAGIIIAGAVVFAAFYKPGTPAVGANPSTQPSTGPSTADIMKSQTGDVIMGSANAPVTLIEYGDYQCPYCAAFFSQTESSIVTNYVNTGKVKFIFRNLVVNDRTAANHESHNSALAVACAADQGKFWEFHDAIYSAEVKDEAANPSTAENNGNLTRTLFMSIAQTLGMDQGQFSSCFDSGKYNAQISQQSSQAITDGANATPTFFVNGQSIVGAQPYTNFQQAFASAGAK